MKTEITGIILAGGQARRMGGQDKGLIEIGQKPLIEYAIACLEPQVDTLIINANRNTDRYRSYGLPVVQDKLSGFKGPLAGMASCMGIVDTEYMVTMPCDSPFVDKTLVDRLYRQLVSEKADISVAHDGGRMQPVFCLMRTDLLNSLTTFLELGERKIDKWFAEHNMTTADCSDIPDTFININTPEDVALAEKQLLFEDET